jgi:SAM-dependent methyltransferase
MSEEGEEGTSPAGSSTREFYEDRYAGDYMDSDDYSVWSRVGLPQRQVVETLRHVSAQPSHVLDYGCGVGGGVGLLSSAYPGARVDGIDISTNAITKARQRFPGARFECFTGKQAPYGNSVFDLIFSYHVLEHVEDVNASIADIARMLKPRGFAVVIFPCGNPGSFLDRMMRLIKDSTVRTTTGESALFFEIPDGHVRRLTSRATVSMFEQHGLEPVAQLFSGHFFGTVDWLCRGTGPAYINRVFRGRPPTSRLARWKLETTRRTLLMVHRLMLRKSLDLTRQRNVVKQCGLRVVRRTAIAAERALVELTELEWRILKRRREGTAQYLVFRKPG